MKEQKDGKKLFGPVAKEFFNVNTSGWRSLKPVFDISKCTQCYNCIQYCPANIIKFNSESNENIKNQYNGCENCSICKEVFLNKVHILYCPTNAVEFESRSNKGITIQMEYCKGCGICAEVCPTGSIHMEKEDVYEQ